MSKDYWENQYCKNIIFKYGTCNDFVFSTHELFISFDNNREFMVKTIGIVSINTTGSNRIINKIEFSSNINFISIESMASAKLEIVLFRRTENYGEIVLSSWLYEVTDSSGNRGETFNFTYCDSNSPKGNSTYFIKVVPILMENCKVVVTNGSLCTISYII